SWAFGLAVPLAWIAACGSSSKGFGQGGSGGPGEDGGNDDGGYVFIPPADDAALMLNTDADMQGGGGSSKCKGGLYQGTFKGNYSSSLTIVGLSLVVTGNVELTLHQEGSGQM